jgi:hypothetical protein
MPGTAVARVLRVGGCLHIADDAADQYAAALQGAGRGGVTRRQPGWRASARMNVALAFSGLDQPRSGGGTRPGDHSRQ